MLDRSDALALDARDPLAPLRALFTLPDGVIYLDGNSLGALPVATAGRVQGAIADEWGTGLIRSWNTAGWVTLPERIAAKIARLIGAGAGEVLVGDSTSVNLYKVLASAMALVTSAGDARRRTIVSERSNFPTDLYIAQSLAAQHGFTLQLVEPDEIAAWLDDRLAILMLTHVNYRTGRMHDMPALTAAAHGTGRSPSGTWPTRRGRCRSTWPAPTPTSRWGVRLQVPQRRARGAGVPVGASTPAATDGA